MIDAHEFTSAQVRRAYDRRSAAYERFVVPMERPQHETAIEAAAPRPGERVLEVAVGPGLTIAELARRVGPDTIVRGVDLSPAMLERARANVARAGLHNVDLQVADATALPFADGSFDLLYNAYMLDLIPFERIPLVLSEFRRLLAPGGRLVLLNMSKEAEGVRTWRERLYQILPRRLVLSVMGGCRPVLMEASVREFGFEDVRRTYLGGRLPAEIVLGRAPGSPSATAEATASASVA